MAGGSPRHNLIANNLGGEFRQQLKGGPCATYNSDLRVKIEATGLYTYPDVTIVCGPLSLVNDQQDTVTNPSVLVEVLAESTEAYDRGKKFEHYRRIPSLKEYLLVRQDEPHIEQFIRTEANQWLLQEATGLDAKLALPSLNITLALADIYERVEFTPIPIRPPINAKS